MVSEFINREKELQDGYLEGSDICLRSIIFEHKQHLKNFKKYLEEERSALDWLLNEEHMEKEVCIVHWAKCHLEEKQNQLKEDIRELNKMIRKYK